MHVSVCGMHGKPSQKQTVSGRVELPTCVYVTRGAAGVFVAVLTVHDTNQHQLVIPTDWRAWAGEAQCFCGLLCVLSGACSDLSRLLPYILHPLTM